MSANQANPRQVIQNDTKCNVAKIESRMTPRKYRENNGLSDSQLAAIELMLQGLSDIAIAQQVGVTRITIYRWRQNKRFVRQLDRRRQALWEESAARLQAMITPALDVLEKQISDEDRTAARHAAAVLLRLATPSRLLPSRTREPRRIELRKSDPPPRAPARRVDPPVDLPLDSDDELLLTDEGMEGDPMWKKVMAYVNAPPPAELEHPSTKAASKKP